MLTTDFALFKLLLCLVIATNFSTFVLCSEDSTTAKSVEITTETATTQVLPEESKIVNTSLTPIKPRIIQRTTVLKRANRFPYRENTTSTTKDSNYYEDDDLNTSTTAKTVDFRPSIHLGEIDGYETRKSSTNPFNNVQHVKFDNSVRIGELDTDRVRSPLVSTTSSSHRDAERAAAAAAAAEARKKNKKDRVKFFETDSRYGVGVPVELEHQQQQQDYFQAQQQVGHHEEDNIDNNNNGDEDNNSNGYNYPAKIPASHETYVTFEYPQSHYTTVTARPMTLGRPLYPSTLNEHDMHVQNFNYAPGLDNVQTIYVKPSKFHGEVEIVTPLPVPAPIQIQHYEFVTPANGEAMEKPEFGHHQASYQVVPQEAVLDNAGKPETVLFLTSHRETAYTRTRKFPYQFYHPGLGYQDNDYNFVQDVPHGYPSKARRTSPWKKILHLVGAFLPLGLLLATLTPNVVKIGNNTQPNNIVLSKLRVVDLPVEHKRGRLVDELDIQQPQQQQQQNTCEDRSICELIVSGSEPRSNLLQNILWTLTNKSTDEEAKKHGLHEIFAAVKRKDCSTIDC